MQPNIIEPLIFWSSVDGGENWTIVEPKDVPDALQGEAIIKRLANGEGAQLPGDGKWYVATKTPRMPSNVRH